MKYNCIELFAGCGGLALGLEQSGFNHIGLVELDKDACNTLRLNRPNWNILNDDIKNISNMNLEELFNIKKYELDLLSGGLPCQSFSYAGKRLGLDDKRGQLFLSFAEFINKLKPKVFMFENVKGLLSMKNGEVFKTITDTFRKEGYTLKHKILNAYNYGIAQKRERLIVVGIREGINDVMFNFPVEYSKKLILRDVIIDVPESDCAQYSDSKRKIFELIPEGGNWKNLDEDIAKEYMKKCWDLGGGKTGILRRLSFNEPSLTILTSPQMKQTDRCHPIENRPLSVRECARIQSFPDDWIFTGSLASKYRQIGNAVPCNLAKELGLSIINLLEKI